MKGSLIVRIPILINATKATKFSGRIPLPVGKFRLEIVGVISSLFTLDNGQQVVDGSVIDGGRTVQLFREGDGEKDITIYAVRVA